MYCCINTMGVEVYVKLIMSKTIDIKQMNSNNTMVNLYLIILL